MLQFQSLLPHRERPVPDGQELLLVQIEVALVIDGPLVLAGHAQRVHRAGLYA